MKLKRLISILLSAVLVVLSFQIELIPVFASDAYDGISVEPPQILSSNYADLGLTEDEYNKYKYYYAIRNAKELYGFVVVENTFSTCSNAVLLNDIVVNENVLNAAGDALNGTPTYTWTPIHKSGSFSGVFDGNGHTISGLYSPSTGTDTSGNGLFARASGTVKNTIIKDSYFGGEYCYYASSFIGRGSSSSTIENCASFALIQGTHYNGGIAGQTNGKITGCYFAGKTKSSYASTSNAIVSDSNNYGTLTNCVYSDDCGLTSGRATSATADKFKSGEACYLLNGGVTNGTQAWYQTIGTDDYPQLSGDTVYYDYVDEVGDKEYTNTPYAHTKHSYVNGLCTRCDSVDEPQLIDDKYQIANYGNLVWFQRYVNDGNTTANAVLTNDITANESLLNADGDIQGTPAYTWTAISNKNSLTYNSVFDGCGHSISGLYMQDNTIYGCLFGYLKGTVKNLCIKDSYISSTSYDKGFIAGYVFSGGVIENCCAFGTLNVSTYCGGIAGTNEGNIRNCYFGGKSIYTTQSAQPIARIRSNGTIENCYYISTCNLASDAATGKTPEQFASGEVCYLLNKGATDGSQVWYQTLGADDYPKFSGGTVYYGYDETVGESTYSNTELTECTHSYINGLCEKCGALQEPELKDGTYQIANYGNLVWFGQYVSSGNVNVGAELTADITANESLSDENGAVNGEPKYIWQPISKGAANSRTAFNSVFDGCGHSISGLYAPDSDEYCGLFGQSNGTIKNILITDSYFGSDTANHSGSVLGYGYSSSVVENCGSDAVVHGGDYCGGLVGETSGKINNSYFAGNINANSESSNAIASDSNSSGTLNSCYYLDTCGLSSARATSKTAEQFSSGEVCYLLNGGVIDGTQVWYQNIITDTFPKFSGAIVCYDEDADPQYYNVCAEHKWGATPTAVVEPTCTDDGYDIYTCINCGTTKNEPNDKSALGHSFNDDGICTVCGEFNATQPQNGDGSAENPYQIASYGHLMWFQQYVDSGHYSINAVLTADITANTDLLNESGEVSGEPKYTWTPIGKNGNSASCFKGVLDGQGHTISGLYAPVIGDYCGLFAMTDGTIKNLIISDSYLGKGYNYKGSFAGYGFSNSVIENCASSATIKGNFYCGGIAGDYSGTISNCYFAGAISADTTYSGAITSDYYNRGTVTNCYYLDTCGLESTRAEARTAEQFASGAVCYLLASGTNGSIWGQKIGTNPYPVLYGETVYFNKRYEGCIGSPGGYNYVYTNTAADELYKDVYNDDGFCIYCDGYQPAVPTTDKYDIDGNGSYDEVYEISNAGQLYWFASLVNGTGTAITQNKSADAVLTTDIVVNQNVLSGGELNTALTNPRTWTPIGNSSNIYTGAFDGQGYTISGLYFNNTDTTSGNYVGLFGYADSNSKISNVSVVDFYFNGYMYISGICGYNDGTIKGCHTKGKSVGKNYTSGVCGFNYGNISRCYNEGSVKSSNNYAGGISSVNYGTIEYCYNTGSFIGNGYLSGICGYNKGTISSCYNTGILDGTCTSNSKGGVCGYVSNGTIDNCYNDSSINSINAVGMHMGGTVGENVLNKTTEQFASGEVCYLLNKGITDGTQVWYQTIGTDDKPLFEGKTVVYNADSNPQYFNLGDVNLNNIINDADAAMVLRYVSGMDTLNEYQLTAADVNNDGKVDMLDAVAILNMVS